MQVEEALISLGDRPLGKSPFSTVLVAVINSYMRIAQGELITPTTPGDIALSRVYELNNAERVLEHKVGIVRDRDSYRFSLTFFSGIIVVVVVIFAGLEIANTTVSSGDFGLGTLADVLSSGIDVFEALLK